MKLISYNVNGIRSCIQKGLLDFINKENADIVMLQEVKALREQVDLSLIEEKYNIFWNPAKRKGYSGTAIFTKDKPMNVIYGLGDFDNNEEGRVITCEFESCYIVCVYTPNAKAELARLDYRQEWDREFAQYLSSLSSKKSVVCAGDLNVAHNEIDLANPKTNHFNPGFSDEERSGFSSILSKGFIDTFRNLYPDKVEYSWFSYKTYARQRNVGWRIDYFLVSEDIISLVSDSKIIASEYSSDHLPISLELSI